MTLTLIKMFAGRWLAGLAKIPWQVWAVLALMLILKVGSCVHQREVKEFGDARFAAGEASYRQIAAELQKKIEELEAEKAAEIRKKADEKIAIVRSDADNLRLRGAGKATCRYSPSADSAGEPQSTAAETGAPGVGVPAEQWAVVPWGWLVKVAEEHDMLIVEAESWREQFAAHEAAVEQ